MISIDDCIIELNTIKNICKNDDENPNLYDLYKGYKSLTFLGEVFKIMDIKIDYSAKRYSENQHASDTAWKRQVLSNEDVSKPRYLLSKLLSTNTIPYRSHSMTQNVRGTNRSCPVCKIELTRLTEANVIRCGLCQTHVIWKTMSVTSQTYDEYIKIEYLSHDTRVRKVIRQLLKMVKNDKTLSYTVGNVIERSTRIEQLIRLRTGMHSIESLLEINVVYNTHCIKYGSNKNTKAGVIRDLYYIEARLLLLTYIKDALKKKKSIESYTSALFDICSGIMYYIL